MASTYPPRWIAQSLVGVALVAALNVAFGASTSVTPQAPAASAVNECATNNGGCGAAECVDTTTGWLCGDACPPGFTGTPQSGCIDVNECAVNNGGCDNLTQCRNVPGSRTCGVCPKDYAGDGYQGCIDVNECPEGDCSGVMKMRDRKPPVITTPGVVAAAATSTAGAAVTFTVTSKDQIDGDRPVECTPASGSTFPVGATAVTCTSIDRRNNKATATFRVVVTK
jgi:hypothetical protein